MTSKVNTFARAAMWMLPVWSVMLFLGTLTHQPDPQTAFPDFAAYITTSTFLWSHLINSILGAALGSIGIIGLMLFLQDSKVAGKALIGMAATVIGNTLNTSVFGAAAFAQPAMGQMFLAGEQSAVDFYNLVYSAPLFITAILALLFFIVGGVFSGLAMNGSGRFPKWVGWVYALAIIGFALGIILPPIIFTITSALLILTTLVVAWKGSRESRMQVEEAMVTLKP